MEAYRCYGNVTLFGEHLAKRGPFETVARELLLTDIPDQLGPTIQDLFTCCPELGREVEDKLGLIFEYTLKAHLDFQSEPSLVSGTTKNS